MRYLLPLFTLLLTSSILAAGLLNVKDSTGESLNKVRDEYFKQYISYRDGIGTITTKDMKGKVTATYQMHKVSHCTLPNLFLTDADRLNGITHKSASSVSCKSFRVKKADSSQWSEWKTGKVPALFYLTLNLEIKKRDFNLIPNRGTKYLKPANTATKNFQPQSEI